jgi:hypothetical protein
LFTFSTNVIKSVIHGLKNESIFININVLFQMNKQGEVNTKSVENQINILANEDIAPRLKEVAKLCYDTGK